MTGRVYLLGAGPGDAGLLTMRGYQLLQEAEVVIYDRLVDHGVMALIPEDTRRVDVGKNAGHHPIPQQQINEILLHEARHNRVVVRLKGGDPFVFGRGGEEAELLAAHGVPFEVIPGVTSAISVPAYAGIPVTHRDYASSLHIITGHGQQDAELNIDYQALAKVGGTLIFLMSIATAPIVMNGLLTAGMPADTPVAVVEKGATPQQRSFTGQLFELAELIRREGVCSPAIIIVGGVCQLAPRLEWLNKRPLNGCRVLVTRPRELAAAFGTALTELGAQVCYYPCIKTSPLDFQLELKGLDWLIFTSAAGVEAFFARLEQEGQDSRALAGLSIAVVGEKTALALKKYGLRADFTPGIFDGEHLARELRESGRIKPGQQAGLYRAQKGSADIVDILSQAGIIIRDIPVYETITTAALPQPTADFDYITFTSASCVEGFVGANGQLDFSEIKALCIGGQTAAAAQKAGMKTVLSEQATTGSMIEKLQEVWHDYQTQKTAAK